MHLLLEQADIRAREWGMVRRYNLEGWEAMKRQWEQLRVQLRLRRESWRKENEKLLDILMTEPSTASLRKKKPTSFRGVLAPSQIWRAYNREQPAINVKVGD